jgi:selenide,water dikinase
MVLDKILAGAGDSAHPDPRLWVGNASRDDAAVYALAPSLGSTSGSDTAVVSTTDFFMPVVDDPFDFGRIAATNAISDIYAMGADPLLAIAILGWPIRLLPPEVASIVLAGGRAACAEAGIPLAGGHSIDTPEPIFGLAVTGIVQRAHLKRNDTGTAGCLLYLTKPLGIGVLTTAEKQGKLRPTDQTRARDWMCILNKPGSAFGKLPAVRAMTDVTGFGLLGHLIEMADGAALTAELYYEAIPVIPGVERYLAEGCIPGGTARNFRSYGAKTSTLTDVHRLILCDPQTSGGLLVAVAPEGTIAFLEVARTLGLDLRPIGRLIPRGTQAVSVLSS